MTGIQELSEADLIALAQAQNQEATDLLMQRYKSIVRKKARHLFLMGGDQDDLMQEGMIGLFKAILGFDAAKEASFSTFAEICISRQLYDAIRSSNRQKNIPLNTYISIYSPVHPREYEGQEEDFMMDQTLEVMEQSPEEILIARTNVEDLMEDIQHRLSDMENQIFDLYMDGMTYQEIARYLQKSPKSVDNALQRIKGKVNQMLEHGRF